MKNRLRSLLALLAVVPAALLATEKSKNCGCACCKGKEVCRCNEAKPSTETSAPAEAAKAEVRHPLKGVIVEVQPSAYSLLVKHEAIPDFMPAMTMLFKVDAATLHAAAIGQSITATLVQREEGFALENVTALDPK